MADELEITFRFSGRVKGVTSLSFSTGHVPRVGENAMLMGFVIDGEPFEYHGIARYVNWIYRPRGSVEVIVIMDDGANDTDLARAE